MAVDAPTPRVTVGLPRAPGRAEDRSSAPSGHRLPHLRALDGLRGVAVLAVVLFHFSPELAPGGFLGVDIFFVLSGFLITSLLVNEFEGARRLLRDGELTPLFGIEPTDAVRHLVCRSR